jgi:hypothetical protein
VSGLTPDDLARLRIPLAQLPGLDSTGLHLWAGERHVTCVYDTVTPYYHTDEHAIVLIVGGDEDTRVEQAPRDEGWAIDLREGAAADRVARWLAARLDTEVGCTAPTWACGSSHDGEQGWTLWGCGAEYWFSCEDEGSVLHGLDPFDDRTLPDGSQWIDRLALALVAQHVGGRP